MGVVGRGVGGWGVEEFVVLDGASALEDVSAHLIDELLLQLCFDLFDVAAGAR